MTDPAMERDALVERLMGATAGMFDIYTTYIGHRLGLYQVLAEHGAATSADMAERSDVHERYVREWLEQQTVIGTLQVDDASAAPRNSGFRARPGLRHARPAGCSGACVAPLTQLMVGTCRPLDSIVEAFRTGGGVPLDEYGSDMREGQGGLNRVAFLTQLGQAWLPTLPDVHARLLAKPPARVAEIGCGLGWASIGLARAYPEIRLCGFDLDAPSIEFAQENARAVGVADRVSFTVQDAARLADGPPYDLVLAFECIHDMADPIAALRAMRAMAGEHGAVVVMDERVGESFSARNDDTEWFMYGFSVLHCLPAAMACKPSAATGTVMRPATLRDYGLEAGFRAVTVLPIENSFYVFYRLST